MRKKDQKRFDDLQRQLWNVTSQARLTSDALDLLRRQFLAHEKLNDQQFREAR